MTRSALGNMARALGGDVVGQEILCPGPHHSPRDRSLSIRLSPAAPDGFVVASFAGDDFAACRDHVKRLLGWENGFDQNPITSHARWRPQCGSDPDPRSNQDENAKIARALAIWDGSVHPGGSIVEHYLASRGIELAWEAAGDAIRFHPACPWRDETSGRTVHVPAMVAALRSIDMEEITGVHRTRLAPDARKVDRRMLGKASGSAVMLTPMSAVGAGLAIGEGIETCLAAMMMGWRPAWALGSVGAVASFPLITGIQSLILLGETNDGGASARAVQVVGERYVTAGREVILVEPKCPGDLNDALRGAA